MSGQLVIAATPIGNAGDASARLRAAFATADVIAAEDTRRTKRLLADLQVTPIADVFSFHEHNERGRVEDLCQRVQGGQTVLVVSDAGMPTVSDPGFVLVRTALDAGLTVRCLPGASAVTTALALSGLPTDRFCFEGFLPRKSGQRASALGDLAEERRTMVFFESPRRLASMLSDCSEAFGADRLAAVSRELTKTYEETMRGTLAELVDWAHGTEVLGEITVVVAGAPQRQRSVDECVDEVLGRVEAGERLKDAARAVAKAHHVPGRELYDMASKRRKDTLRHDGPAIDW